MQGIVFDIQRFSVHDGPGIRTTVFLKGCSLRCFWCHNPEGLYAKPEIQFFPDRCIGCGECINACPRQAHKIQNNSRIYLRDRCMACGKCTENCYTGALELIGRQMTVESVIEEILKDREFYKNSNGGVTLSGGEPVIQCDFSKKILEQCKRQKLHTAIETCGNYHWKNLALLLPVTDLVMIDIKHLDSKRHQELTGSSNKYILENAGQLAKTDIPVIFRIPLVPSVNDTLEEVERIAKYISDLNKNRPKKTNHKNNGIKLELLQFHKFAEYKYRALGLDYQASNLNSQTEEKMIELKQIARACNVTVI